MKDVKNVYKFNTLEFLNAGLDEIYCNGKHCVSEKDLLYLKETMAAIILRFERMCRYTYYSDIYIPKECYGGLFREQFPFIYERFHNKSFIADNKSYDGITYYLKLLGRLRNLNLHATITNNLAISMRVDHEFIDNFPKISEKVAYSKNGVLSISGMLIMAMSIIRTTSAGVSDNKKIAGELEKTFYHFANIWGEVIWGRDYFYQKSKEVYGQIAREFRTNYEVEIRKPIATNNALEMIFGELYPLLTIEHKENVSKFDLDLSNREGVPNFGVSGELAYGNGAEVKLVICKGSNMAKFFYEDYKLTIDDKDKFISVCNTTPPFMCVAYMYHNKINRISLLKEDDLRRIKKLNSPKFYLDKDLTILCSGERYADMREINKGLTDGMVSFFLRFESDVIFNRGIFIDRGYSKLSKILSELGIEKDLATRVTAIRNFCGHYGLLNNVQMVDENKYYFMDIPFIMRTMEELFAELDRVYFDNVKIVRKIWNESVINRLVGIKYKRLFEKSLEMFSCQDLKIIKAIEDFERAWKVVENSAIDSEAEKEFICTERTFEFVLKNRLWNGSKEYRFQKLLLACIEGDGLTLNGVEVPQGKVRFFKIGEKVPNKFSIRGKKAEIKLIKKEEIGILEKTTYIAVPMEE